MASLPMDIIFTLILPKLPAKSLLRFKCVSKSFLAEITTPNFIKHHHLNALSSEDNRHLIVPFNQHSMYIYDLDSPHALPLVCHYPKPVPFIGSPIVASCQFYILIDFEDLILFNPSTRTYRELPRVENDYLLRGRTYGMCHCFDEFNDDYKIVMFVDFDKRYGRSCLIDFDNQYREIMVYSLTTGLWKLIECKRTVDHVVSPQKSGVLVQNHLLHLILKDHHIFSVQTRIGCFNIKAEQWANDVPLPDNLFDDSGTKFIEATFCYALDLGLLDGKLCFLVTNLMESTYNFWIMKDYGIKESWTKLMNLPISIDVANPRFFQFCQPVAYRDGSPHKLLCWRNGSGTFFGYNHSDKEVIEAEFNDIRNWRHCLAYICKGSLVNLSGGQSIKASSIEEDDDDRRKQAMIGIR